MNATLYEKIGGKEIVKKLLIIFMSTFSKMNAFLTYVFGGNSLYTGKTMRRAHTEAVAAGLSDIHFDAMMRCVEKSLQESHVQQEHIDQVLPVIEKHRRDILNR